MKPYIIRHPNNDAYALVYHESSGDARVWLRGQPGWFVEPLITYIPTTYRGPECQTPTTQSTDTSPESALNPPGQRNLLLYALATMQRQVTILSEQLVDISSALHGISPLSLDSSNTSQPTASAPPNSSSKAATPETLTPGTEPRPVDLERRIRRLEDAVHEMQRDLLWSRSDGST